MEDIFTCCCAYKRRSMSSMPMIQKRNSQSLSTLIIRTMCNPWVLLLAFALIYSIGFVIMLGTNNNNTIMDNDQHHHSHGEKTNPMDLLKDLQAEHGFSFEHLLKDDPQLAGLKSKNKYKPHPMILHDKTIPIEPWRIVENNKSFIINNNPNLEGKFIPLSNPWGTKYLTRVLCLIPTLWPDRKKKMDIIAKTWGPGCTKLMWVVDAESNPPSSYAGFDTFVVSLTRKQNNEKHVRNIWEKVHRTWSIIYNTPEILNNYEWFIKADDDTFIATQNLFGFLQYYDSSYPHYIGHSIRSRWSSENVVFNSGICYVLSRETIKRIGKYQQHLPTLGTSPGRSHCIDRDGAGEDPTTGICLLGVGIRPDNTMDHNLRERFLIFRDTDHAKIFREDTWFWKYKPEGVGEGTNCCSPYLISMHNYKSVKDAEKYFPILMKQYNQPKDWDKIILPPQPRLFLYDKAEINFEKDEYLNVANPPRGQRIYKGVGKEWICNKCDIGNPKDPYWTEWWDGKQESPSQHVEDAYSPIKSSES